MLTFQRNVNNNISYRGKCTISGDGQHISIGYPNNGKVIVYFWNDFTNSWEQLGGNIQNFSFGLSFGYSVDLNYDGTRIAINAEGAILVYDFDGGSWNLTLEIPDSPGVAKLSDNGSYLAIGNQNQALDGNSLVGMVTTLDITNNNWQLYGDTIYGENTGDRFGEHLEISSDGQFIITSSRFNSDNANHSGHVKIFNFDGNEWNQIGNTIKGTLGNEQLGWSVDITDDGNTIAVSKNTIQTEGNVTLYRLVDNSWQILGTEIIGANAFEAFGGSISISGGGDKLVGAGYTGNYNMLLSNGVIRAYTLSGITKCLDTINHTFMTVYFSPILRYKNTHYPKG